ncbi:MarR family winged helix-turn-helix transcriptional regulator [Aliifodinibius sp. S!AR15-10]|uniref:MarR family winged helix-turn-helix transcriptional regulator n=1 Tax=Aliifodinibius sp. S!AR15-10 TaxID=2950437 RepID=UPI002860BC69|nr:MarR family winged helix-turn-helix transcriptional regulator [Aliifodinibius sp. S!AR15-10]MDR8393973.1 MarR family winged helix-turn-helix transcriptional regulator [Aliifodinibius sp. S!AR15-10]
MANQIPKILDDAVGFNVYRVALLFRKELQTALSEYNLTPEQWQVMQTLWSTDDMVNQNDIAYLTLKDKHNISRMIARMEKNNWIKRRQDPTDGRAYIIESTQWAKNRREEVRTKLLDHFSEIFDVVSQEELDQLLETMKKFRRRLEDQPKQDD